MKARYRLRYFKVLYDRAFLTTNGVQIRFGRDDNLVYDNDDDEKDQIGDGSRVFHSTAHYLARTAPGRHEFREDRIGVIRSCYVDVACPYKWK